MEIIDMNTLMLLYVLGNIFTITFFALYNRFNKVPNKKMTLFVLAKLIQTVSWIFYAFNVGNLNVVIMTFLAPLNYFGFALESYCMVTTTEGYSKKKWKILISLAIITSILHSVTWFDLVLRIFVSSIGISVIYFYVWNELSLRKIRTGIEKVAGWMAFWVGILFLIRAVFSISSQSEFSVTDKNITNVLAGLSIFITSTLWPLIFLLFINRKDNKELEDLNATKDKFFGIISHDLKNPIGQLMQISTVLENKVSSIEDKQLKHLFQAMKESSNSGFKLLENLLQWSRSQTGIISFKPESFSVYELVEENSILLEGSAQLKNITLTNKVYQMANIYADRNMISTVIRNLLSNAIKFSYENSSIEIFSKKNPKGIEIMVKDTGQGMSKDAVKKLFEIGTNQSTLGTNNERGTGLGLILCKEFVTKHNGTIWAESELNKGTTIFFSIPTND